MQKSKIYINTTSPAIRAAAMMRHRDFQKECILRGLEFENILKWNHTELVQWFVENYENGLQPTRLSEFDAYVDEQLRARGYKVGDTLMSPSLKFGYIPPMEPRITPNPSMNRPRKIEKPIDSPPTPKRERNTELGVMSGTKKELTYQLAKLGKPISEIVKVVTEKFPEAKESSIKIWVSRCKKGE